MKNVLIVMLCLLGGVFASAQSDSYQGYMGKKFALKYHGGAGVTLGNRSNIGFSFSHGPEIEYVLKEKWSILASLEFQYFKKKLESYYVLNAANYDPSINYSNKVNNTLFLLKFRRYFLKRGSFAPYGTYYGFQMGVIRSKFSYYSDENDFLKPESKTSMNPIFGFHFGRQFIFAKRMIIDAGVSTSIPIALNNLYNSNSYIVGYQSPEENLMLSQLFRVYIALGFLAF